MLTDLAADLHRSLGILQKQDIQPIAQRLGLWVPDAQTAQPIHLGDDCAAIADGDGYLLLAAEGMWAELVRTEPWFAGWCGVLVNVSDIYAMGGRPIAVVDALWSQSPDHAQQIWAGMAAAAKTFNVPIVGGHTNCHGNYEALSVAILGRASKLITSFDARPGDQLVLVTNFNGQPHPRYPFWDAATMADPAVLRQHLELLPALAEQGLCRAGKDISMGGLVGTTLMLLETSGCGAVLELEAIPHPPGLDWQRWLVSFPSYGFVLSLTPEQVMAVQPQCHHLDLVCQVIGQVVEAPTLTLTTATESLEFWDFSRQRLTGFSHH